MLSPRIYYRIRPSFPCYAGEVTSEWWGFSPLFPPGSPAAPLIAATRMRLAEFPIPAIPFFTIFLLLFRRRLLFGETTSPSQTLVTHSSYLKNIVKTLDKIIIVIKLRPLSSISKRIPLLIWILNTNITVKSLFFDF